MVGGAHGGGLSSVDAQAGKDQNLHEVQCGGQTKRRDNNTPTMAGDSGGHQQAGDASPEPAARDIVTKSPARIEIT
jgi:hypothetical protein